MTSSRARILELDRYKSKNAQKCIFCYSSEELRLFKKRIVCLHCLKSIRSLYYDGFFNKIKGAN